MGEKKGQEESEFHNGYDEMPGWIYGMPGWNEVVEFSDFD